jgi:hypothetical protein
MFAVDIEPSDPESDSESATDLDMPELIQVELSRPPSPRPVRPTCDRAEDLGELGPTLTRRVSPRPTRPTCDRDEELRELGPTLVRWDLDPTVARTQRAKTQAAKHRDSRAPLAGASASRCSPSPYRARPLSLQPLRPPEAGARR